MSAPFDEAEAAVALGFPGARFVSITPYMIDGVYWIIIGSNDRRLGRPVIVKHGHVVTDVGYAVGMSWLRELAALNKSDLRTEVVPQVLRWYESLPIGWNESYLVDPQTNERGGVTLHPIEVKLVAGDYIRPRPRIIPPGPPGQPDPYAEPSAGPLSGGPSGGYAPPRPCRATLREVDGKLTWTIEVFDPFSKRWNEELRDAAE
jgi:hypothetical protein